MKKILIQEMEFFTPDLQQKNTERKFQLKITLALVVAIVTVLFINYHVSAFAGV